MTEDVTFVCCLQEEGLPAAEERLSQSGLQAVPGQPTAAGGRVRLRRGSHPSAPRRVRLPERSEKRKDFSGKQGKTSVWCFPSVKVNVKFIYIAL